MMPKKTAGRQKIEMKKIEKKSSRQVTFSKRRGGLFKKAAELCVMTGAEVAIIVESPGNHVYTFGHRNVDSLIETYLGNNVSLSENPTSRHEEVYNKYLEITNELDVEKSKSKNVVEESDGCWWENSFEDLEMDELEVFIKSLEELKDNVVNRADELRNSVTSSSLINTNGADELKNLVTSSLFDTNTNLSNEDGLLDDQVNLSDLDQFLPNNIEVTNQDLLTLQPFNYNSGAFTNNSFGNGELALANQDYVNVVGNNYQVSSAFSTPGVPSENYFGHGQR